MTTSKLNIHIAFLFVNFPHVLSPSFTQCCQLLAKRVGQMNQKIWPPAKKFGPS
jgi:hypothetical protein